MATKPTDASTEDAKPPQGENVSSLPEEQRPPGDLRRRSGKTKRKGPFVKYVGSAALREINSTAWKSLAIDLNQKVATHTWSVANDKLVEADKFSDAQLDYLLIDDLQQGSNTHAFLLVDYDNSDPPQLVQVAYE